MTALDELRAESAWRAATAACALNAFFSPFDLLTARHLRGVPIWPMLGTSGLGLALFLLLVALGRRTPRTISTTIFVVNAIALASFLWAANSAYALAVGGAFHYEYSKLSALGAALLAPGLVSGVVSIGAFAGGAVIHVMLLPASVRHELYAEPIASFIYGAIAIALLVYSQRRRRLEWEMVLARAAAAVRDLMNTPLQTLTLALALLGRDRGSRRQLDLIARSVRRLRELNALLASYEARWPPMPDAFDARALLSEGRVRS